MANGEYHDSEVEQPTGGGNARPQGSSVKRVLGTVFVVIGFCILGIIGYGFGIYAHFLRGANPFKGGYEAVVDPRSGFPDKDRIIICCMGIDDNWTDKDEVFTTGSRTDTLFLMSLDLASKKVSMLSIPRDTYVPIAGTRYSSKINSAYATGGPRRTETTIENWIGVTPDYYVVLNIDATKKLVDALGGVDVDVEHQMDYDDNWGQLHVHLKPGFQHLDGPAAVAFARYRHGNHGVTPEDGDERRMYRQHVLLRAMIAQAKTPTDILKFGSLVDTAMDCVHTDLSRQQITDLGMIFHSIDQDTDLQTASLTGEDARGANGAYLMIVDQKEAKLYCDWMLYGNDNAGRQLTPVRIANATSRPGMAKSAEDMLRESGYQDALTTGNIQSTNPGQTIIIDEGVPDKAAVQEIATSLGITNPVVLKQPVQPNKFGWTPSPVIKVELGADYTPKAVSNTAGLNSSQQSTANS